MLIPLSEYAKMHGRALVTVRQMAARGSFETARKIGRNWVIDSEEPYIDHRVVDGSYRNYRKKSKNK